jgi:hypothetical protein
MSAYASQADWLPRHSFVLDAPVERVWPLVLDWTQWIVGYRAEHVSGPAGAVGEVKQITSFGADGSTTESFQVEVVRIEQNERLAYRLLPLEAPLGAIEAITGYEIFNLAPDGARTFVTYQTIALAQSTQPADVLNAQIEAMYAGGLRAWDESHVPNLRALLA